MKIGILTQPLHNNYGGLLQAYALKETLHSLGHDTVIINRRAKNISWLRKQASILKSRVIKRDINPSFLLNNLQKTVISQETLSFQKKYIPELSNLITDTKGMFALNEMGFDAYIVGSDQCWRPRYSPNIHNYFLDFAKDKKDIRRISYAASFGVSEWEFTGLDTNICRNLLEKFDAISVRENSGIELVENYLGRDDAINVVDPTMLLPLEKYEDIISKERIDSSVGALKVYILDKNKEKNNIVNFVKNTLNIKPFEVLPTKRLGSEKVTNDNVKDFVYPNPAKWLRGFKDAKFVITDSYHGTLFSILFNVPFITIGNTNRGMARFESLLNMFELRDRLIAGYSEDDINDIICKKIDWPNINIKIKDEQDKAINFLKTNLQ